MVRKMYFGERRMGRYLESMINLSPMRMGENFSVWFGIVISIVTTNWFQWGKQG